MGLSRRRFPADSSTIAASAVVYANDIFFFQGESWSGWKLRDHIRETMYRLLFGESAPYNRRFVTNDVACTTASIVAAAIGIRNLDEISEDGKNLIKRIHLLLAMFNACQPGVFAISGWDIVGALPLPTEAVADLMRDGDTRWIRRGAYDLADPSPETTLVTSLITQTSAL